MLIENLKNKVFSRFRDVLINQQIQYIFLAIMKNYLQSLNDDQRVFLIDQDRKARLIVVRNTHAFVAIFVASIYASKIYVVSFAIIVLFKLATLVVVLAKIDSSLATIQCHKCKRLDHYMRNCSKFALVDVHEIEKYEIDSKNV